MSDYRVANCLCPTCRSEHRDMVDLDIELKLSGHKRPRVIQECDNCLAMRAGEQALSWWTRTKEKELPHAPSWAPPER